MRRSRGDGITTDSAGAVSLALHRAAPGREEERLARPAAARSRLFLAAEADGGDGAAPRWSHATVHLVDGPERTPTPAGTPDPGTVLVAGSAITGGRLRVLAADGQDGSSIGQ